MGLVQTKYLHVDSYWDGYVVVVIRQTFLPRITLSNIWEPASRESCGGNVWKMFQNAVSILFSKSILQVRLLRHPSLV